MATTTPDNLWSPDLTTGFVPTTDLKRMQDTVQDALNARPSNYQIGTNAQRLALSGSARFEGLRFYTTDTDTDWMYNGTTWITAEPGTYVVRATTASGTGVTTSADGTIAFTNTTNVSVNGVFTTRFRRYRIDVMIDSASADGDMRFFLRNAGSNIGGGNHDWIGNQSEMGGGPTRSQGVAEPSARLGRISTGGAYCMVEVMNMAHSFPKMGKFTSIDNGNYSREGSLKISVTSSADGFSLGSTNSSAFSGRIRVYGLV